ncbi:NAD(P)H-dependent oxidoreductase [Campylobacter sp. MIT 21-1685]|uniref:NAD(P)H-dependent oxidoreductase n=1 Tax=unclassified Campylobacter TaxID=2593542 RepID=UPI00224A58AE|nr:MULTISPECIES: NAD(P)H-dependent oxidoreductase [unclassified Campylobacter]MCX2683766.1 NAD(P)H-dependent oxidoreductase [Campylobacter sp. MIT 21-1684]MCX2752059.1 NAD(P)H-dependent oxidoreductase [Campylobacter sp. MIT 21-1682]MCX2808243.1 NAD(P)H-dependent oxidoreductase [Campylobacter sp. MIT 21-1685]
MRKIILLNGAKNFGSSQGKLNETLHNFAKKTLQNLGFEIDETIIDEGYEAELEVQKILQADVLIWQMPAWWMGEPWIVKKYIDEVLTAGYGVFFKNDGRSHTSPTKNYGKGGLLQGKKYMFSLTWNAPLEAFTDKDEFFNGIGIDGVYLHLHKAHEFIGMSALKTFLCTDVIKNPQVPLYLKAYEKHLKECLV